MYEVELKIRAAHDPIRDELTAIGATAVGNVTQTDTYYNAPHRDFAKTDEALRVRCEKSAETTTTYLTYKGPLIEQASKTRKEAETAVEDSEAIRTILNALGFTPLTTVRKKRERFNYESYTITLDSVEDLGEFVEIERVVSEDIERAREEGRRILRNLGLNPDEHVRTSYLDLQLTAE